MTVDRRMFLRGSGAVALAVGAAGVMDSLAVPGSEAAAAGPFPIGGRDSQLVAPATLDYRSGFQSMAWSPQAKTFLYAQPSPGKGHSGTIEAKHYGDLLVSTLSLKGTTSPSHMQLDGFGHGGTMGVEISPGKHSYIWIDTNAHVDGSGDADARAICCFRYTGSGTYHPSDLGTSRMPHSQRYVLKPGSTSNSVSYDPSTRSIVLRYSLKDVAHYAVYDVAQLRKTGNKTVPRYDAIPASHVEAGHKGSYQSFAMWGDWLYALHGTKSKNDATLHAYNLKTKRASHADLHAAPSGRSGREPEGLCVYTGSSTPRLAFGIKNDPKSGSKRQTSAIYYKS